MVIFNFFNTEIGQVGPSAVSNRSRKSTSRRRYSFTAREQPWPLLLNHCKHGSDIRFCLFLGSGGGVSIELFVCMQLRLIENNSPSCFPTAPPCSNLYARNQEGLVTPWTESGQYSERNGAIVRALRRLWFRQQDFSFVHNNDLQIGLSGSAQYLLCGPPSERRGFAVCSLGTCVRLLWSL
jgi:hypothetical protein